MPRCGRCGAESPEGAGFCVICGQAFAESAPEQPPAAPLPAEAEPVTDDLSRSDRILTEAFALSDQGRLTEAVRLAQQALSYNPNSTTAHSLLGTIYERLGNRDAAIREYQTVLSLSPASTADRQRLNELLGMPAAPEPTPTEPRKLPRVSRRPELLYLVGFTALAIVVIAAILILLRKSSASGPSEVRAALTPPAATERDPRLPTVVAAATTPLPVPGVAGPSSPAAGGVVAPELPVSSTDEEAAPAAGSSGEGAVPEYEDPTPEIDAAPVVLPYPGYTPTQDTPPRFLPGGGMVVASTPTVRTPAPVSAAAAASNAQPNIRAARQFVVAGRLDEAKEVYEATLASNPAGPPRLRVELATVYFRLNQRSRAATQYRQAYQGYRDQLAQGSQGVDAAEAQHGLATCEAGLRALGIEPQ